MTEQTKINGVVQWYQQALANAQLQVAQLTVELQARDESNIDRAAD